MKGFISEYEGAHLFFNKSGPCDLAVVINFSRGFHFTWKTRSIVKWLMEPDVPNMLAFRYTNHHSSIFSAVYAHNADHKSANEFVEAPMVPPHVPILDSLELLKSKSKMVSAIGSVQRILDFHKIRTRILDGIEQRKEQDIDVFGKGRTFIAEKSDGLRSYRYSIAIENSVSENYWTEKIADCFLNLTVPVYLGAPNIRSYFPAESLIQVTEHDLTDDLESLLTNFSKVDYERRIPALLEARELVVGKYNFGKQLGFLLADALENKPTRRIARVWTSDTFIGVAVNLIGSVLLMVRRHSSRIMDTSKSRN